MAQRQYQHLIVMSLVSLLLFSCAVVDEQPGRVGNAPDRHRAQLLATLSSWSAQGRLAIRLAGKSWQLKFKWCQSSPGEYRLLLSGPWGRTLAVVEQSLVHARLLRPGEADVFASDAGELLRMAFGWQLPVAGLQQWLPGRAQQRAELVWDEQGRLAAQQRDGWRVNYKRYMEKEDLSMPALLVISRQQQGKKLLVSIVIDNWEIVSEDVGRVCLCCKKGS